MWQEGWLQHAAAFSGIGRAQSTVLTILNLTQTRLAAHGTCYRQESMCSRSQLCKWSLIYCVAVLYLLNNNSTPSSSFFLPIFSVQDLDMEQDLKCLMETFGPCCTHSWLSLPFDDGGGPTNIVQLCGHNETLRQRVFTVKTPGKSVHVKFHSLGNHFMRRGFQLHFTFS